ncbi:MAG TPA: hypothetical protein VM784_07665 [Actinomycetota bacterium]|nr:hypothetical protein [Actinomycetota bacterium]
MSKKLLFVSTGAMAILLTALSVAWACTNVQGQTVVSPSSIDDPNSTASGDQCGADHTFPTVHSNTRCTSTESWSTVTSTFQKSGYRQYWHYPGIKAGWTFTATGVGARPSEAYKLYLLNHWRNTDTMLICMGNAVAQEVEIGGGVSKTADGSGNIAAITGTIPSGAQATDATTGPAAVCHISPPNSGTGAPDWGTNPYYFTILP